ncbi:unnamed protein product, partial [marine sediment metagenome]
MSSDLSTRVRSYAAQLEHEVAHVTVAEIERRLADTAVKPQVDIRRQVPIRRKRPRPVVVVVVASLVTLLLIGVVALTGLAGGNDPDVIDAPPTVVTTIPTVVTTIPTSTVSTTIPVASDPLSTTRIAFHTAASDGRTEHYEIFVMAIDGSEVTRLYQSVQGNQELTDDSAADWSPDGT